MLPNCKFFNGTFTTAEGVSGSWYGDLGFTPASCLNLTIMEVKDTRDNVAYNPESATPRGTVDGNRAKAKVKIDNCGAAPQTGTLKLLRGSITIATLPNQTVGAGIDARTMVEVLFSAEGLAWDSSGRRTQMHPLRAQFTTTEAKVFEPPFISFVVRPRPVILVHGYNDTAGLQYSAPGGPG